MSQSKLDANQVIKSSYDDAAGGLKTINIASLVSDPYDYISLTYVAAGNGAGEIETVTYKSGGSGGTTVAVLTLAYGSNNKISSITRS